MLESIEKLREYIGENFVHGSSDWECLARLTEEIEREISERYMLLPVDADGVPIRVGDTVIDYKTERSVVAIAENAIVMDGYTDGDSIRIGYAVNHPHVKPRTVEDVLTDFAAEIHAPAVGSYELRIEEYAPKYAAEIRELLGVGE